VHRQSSLRQTERNAPGVGGASHPVYPEKEDNMRKIRTQEEEIRLYNEQVKEITKKYGKHAARGANYGWGQTDYEISTKVYGPGMVVTSFFKGNRVIHEHNSL
jgi:hypothetical protein